MIHGLRAMRLLLLILIAVSIDANSALAVQNCAEGTNRCVQPPPPPPPTQYGTHTYAPAFMVVTLLYTPPGLKSSASFGQSNTEGTTTSLQTSFGSQTTVDASWKGFASAGVSFGVGNTQSNQTSIQTTSTSGSGFQVSAASDSLVQQQDQIVVLLNPLVTVKQTGPSSAAYSLGTVNNAPLDLVSISYAEARDPSTIPQAKMQPHIEDGIQVPGLSKLQPADFATIAAMDPCAAATPNCPSGSNPGLLGGRYVYAYSAPVEGPDQAGDPVVPFTFTLADGTLTQTVQSESYSYSVGISEGGDVPIVPGVFTIGVDVKEQMTWSTQTSRGSSSSNSEQANISLGTSSVGCSGWIDIYSDTVYHTFFFTWSDQALPGLLCPQNGQMPTDDAIISNVLKDSSGQTIPHELVTVTLPDGSSRRVFTDSQGRYKVYGPSQSGTGTIYARGVTGKIGFGSSQPVNANPIFTLPVKPDLIKPEGTTPLQTRQ